MARRRPAEPTVNPARGAALVVVAVADRALPAARRASTRPRPSPRTPSDDGIRLLRLERLDRRHRRGHRRHHHARRSPPGRRPRCPPSCSTTRASRGAAGKYSDALAAAGYQLTNPDGANADAEGDAATTVIYFAPGFEAEAAAVAAAIGAPDTVVPDRAAHHPAGPDRRRQRGRGDRHRPRQRHPAHGRHRTTTTT